MTPPHFLGIADVPAERIRALLDRAAQLKAARRSGDAPLRGRTLVQIFEKPSLRTRLSFDVAMAELGGHSSYLSPAEVGLGRRESVSDVARVVARMVDAVVLRTHAHETIEEFARHSSVPVVNGLSDLEHPCQALADVLTVLERKGTKGVTVTYIGDGNNVAHSLMLCAAKAGLSLRVAAPAGFEPQPRFVELAREAAARSGATLELGNDPERAVAGADAIYTDVWTSMGQEAEYERRRRAFRGFQVNAALLARAKPDCIVMHDLPAHRGEEVTDEVLDGPQSVVFEQAENRLHAQKAILCWLLAKGER